MRTKIILLILLAAFTTNNLSAQKSNKKISITGVVTDAENKPLAGALVLIDGKNTNATTNENGIYKLKVRPDADSITILTFTIGMSTAPINGRTKIDFVLSGTQSSQISSQNNPADDKQVNVGYGSVNEKNLLTPVSSIDGTSSRYDNYKDIYELLKGTPGVIVKGKSVQIQGTISINSGTEPLYVVDGMVVESVDYISPTLVESISVLKGVSASIYGSRGANGVILITLRSGSTRR